MNFSLPTSLWETYNAVPRDQNDNVNELPAGKALGYWLTTSNTHTDRGNPYGQPVVEFGPASFIDGCPKLQAYAKPINNDWVVDSLPPIGTAVWQIKGPLLQIVRTSTIASYSDGFVKAALTKAGPYPGTPIGGDSGSLCFVKQAGRWKVVGICNSSGTCDTPFWTFHIPTGIGNIPPRIDSLPILSVAQDHYFAEPTIIPFPMRLFLDSKPTNRRVVGAFAEGDDGTDNVVLDVPCSKEPKSIVITGTHTDCWAWPDNGKNWIIRAIRLDEARIRLFFKESRQAESYFVTIDGMPTIRAFPEEGDTEIIEKPSDNPSDTMLLSQLSDALEENDRLSTMLASEQARSAELQAKIDSFRAAINSIIK